MKRTIAGFAAGITMAAGGVLVAVAPAHADTPGCVSQSEFRAAKKHMTKAKVASIFDTAGKRESIAHGYGTTIEIRSYKTCSPYGSVAVSYTNGKLTNKSAVF